MFNQYTNEINDIAQAVKVSSDEESIRCLIRDLEDVADNIRMSSYRDGEITEEQYESLMSRIYAGFCYSNDKLVAEY
jgi:ferredoxin-fold anticodon binding domain-containing protein